MTTEIYRRLTNNVKPFIVAELGSNHMGSLETAKNLIDAAAEAGCDAVKFQSWAWDTMESREALDNQNDYVRPGFTVVGLESVKKQLALSPERHRELKEHCDQRGIIFSSTAFSKDQVDMLVQLGVPYLKIASYDLVHHKFLHYAASKGLPIVLSTGMANVAEIAEAVDVIKSAGNNQIVLLHCVSVYPTPEENVNLRNITLLQNAFHLPVGFSDHSISTDIPISSVALGACFIEKHFRLEGQECREKRVSIIPSQMKQVVIGSAKIGKSMGSFKRAIDSEAELASKLKMRRSLVAKGNLMAGQVLTEADIAFKRPGRGIPAKDWKYLVGRKLKVNKEYDKLFSLEDFE